MKTLNALDSKRWQLKKETDFLKSDNIFSRSVLVSLSLSLKEIEQLCLIAKIAMVTNLTEQRSKFSTVVQVSIAIKERPKRG